MINSMWFTYFHVNNLTSKAYIILDYDMLVCQEIIQQMNLNFCLFK